METIEWNGCYDGSWKGLISEDSFAHPAKFAPGLIKRILAHGVERGWWKRGDLLGDPFGGIAGGGIMAGYAGLNWLGVELEPRFVELGNKNIALHAPTWLACGDASLVKLVQGDSRRFAEIVYGAVAGVVTSPPFASDQSGGGIAKGGAGNVKVGTNCGYQNQGESTGQIAALKPGAVDAVISSPPYAESVKGDHREIETAKESHAARTNPGQGGSLGKSQRFGGYGATAGNIGNLKEGDVDGVVASLGSLKAVVSSPPWEQNSEGAIGAHKFKDAEAFARKRAEMDAANPKCHSQSPESRIAQFERDRGKSYGSSTGQIAKEAGETYWHAMRLVYAQCLLALKPGGYMAIVVKDYVKDKARVPLCDDTLRLLVSLGFEPVERIRAMLVKTTTHEGMFGTITKTTERKSFFRRLAEKKGSPPINWEEVIVVRRPL